MTTLDSVARQSAAAIDTAVSRVPVRPFGSVAGVGGLALARRTAGYALAGAVGVVLAVISLIAVVQPAEDVTDVTRTTTSPTTVAEPTTPTTLPAETAPPVVPIVGEEPDEPNAPRSTAAAPMLRIVSPEPNTEVATQTVEVVGIAEIGASVWAPDGSAIEVGVDGVWSYTAEIEVGMNRLGFSATNDTDMRSVAYVDVTRSAPPTTTTTKPKPTTTTTTKAVGWGFTAHNTYGSCELDPPYDVFYGTGKPGTEIQVISDYGAGSTVVGEEGNWEITVFFPEAPPGEEFAVKVKDFTGAKKIFEFVFTG